MGTLTNLDDIFVVKAANDIVEEQKNTPMPKKLWNEFWYEGEVCCLFSGTNTGKSILAVQIGNAISKSIVGEGTTAYYDFELSDKQFSLRYTDSETNEAYKFSDKFMRISLDTDVLKSYCSENKIEVSDVLIKAIEGNIIKMHNKYVIIDNISWLIMMDKGGSPAAKLMSALLNFKKKYGISILVLAHTPKLKPNKPITKTDLRGSAVLGDFFDSMFAIGKSPINEDVKYLKQIKVRMGAFKYDSNNVEKVVIKKDKSFLYFHPCGFSDETSILSAKETKGAARKTVVKHSTKRARSRAMSSYVLSKASSSVLKYLK